MKEEVKDTIKHLIEDEHLNQGEKSSVLKDLEFILSNAETLPIPQFDKKKIKDSIDQSIDRSKKGFNISKTIALGIVLLSVVLISIYAHFFMNKVTIKADATQYAYELPDGSNVILGTNSNIEYTKDFKERIVQLDGVAFFNVEKGSEFRVKTSEGTIRVLGTSFEVVEDEGVLSVSCHSGIVEVNSLNSLDTIYKGQSITKIADFIVRDSFTLDSVADISQLDFEKIPLGVVFAKLERHYKVEISAPSSIYERRFTGQLPISNLGQGMEMLKKVFQFNYDRSGDRIEVTK